MWTSDVISPSPRLTVLLLAYLSDIWSITLTNDALIKIFFLQSSMGLTYKFWLNRVFLYLY